MTEGEASNAMTVITMTPMAAPKRCQTTAVNRSAPKNVTLWVPCSVPQKPPNESGIDLGLLLTSAALSIVLGDLVTSTKTPSPMASCYSADKMMAAGPAIHLQHRTTKTMTALAIALPFHGSSLVRAGTQGGIKAGTVRLEMGPETKPS